MASRSSGASSRHRWLLLVPLVWQLAMAGVVNDVPWAPLGLPFPMVWQMAGVLVCVGALRLVFVLDRRGGLEREEAEFLARTTTGDHVGEGAAS
ncbi:DUF3311 domain-containing protein [Amycolatopsis jejuensis]|uniref:DUF3311 domain-containing protein n=1 Tax=Amycolatopsis jejuensis TaxID=330084 RepID=UPI000524CD36|nr:DUF3311 domain-containing protein [Amycolatopsis jejuensis]